MLPGPPPVELAMKATGLERSLSLLKPIRSALFRMVAGIGIVAALAFPAYAFAGPSSDAVVMATPFAAKRGLTGAYAQCPAGQRVVGGGVLHTASQQVYLGASGPLDSTISPPINPTTAAQSTVNGDVATQWYAGVSNPVSDPAAVKTFALCSASSDATVRVASFSIAGRSTGVITVKCPTGQRALGGGVIQYSWPDNRILASGPLDSSGQLSNTTDGDIATKWYSAVHNWPNHTVQFKAFAICSADSQATIQATPFSVAGNATGGARVRCPDGQRVVGGGIVQGGPAKFIGLRDSGPLDDTGLAANTDDGDLGRRWYATVENRNPHKVNFKVLAVCELD
jgi:hypothetical protein